MQGPEPLSRYVFGEVLIQLFWAQVNLEHGITEEALKCEESVTVADSCISE